MLLRIMHKYPGCWCFMQTQYEHYTADNIRDKIIIVNSQMFLNYLHFSLLCYIILNFWVLHICFIVFPLSLPGKYSNFTFSWITHFGTNGTAVSSVIFIELFEKFLLKLPASSEKFLPLFHSSSLALPRYWPGYITNALSIYIVTMEAWDKGEK